MTIHSDSSELLAAIPRVLDGVALSVVAHDGRTTAEFGAPVGAVAAEVRTELPAGAIVASYAVDDAGTRELVAALLGMVAQRERLEHEIDSSMIPRSNQLMEQVDIFSDTLPKLADRDYSAIAKDGVEACHRATGVCRVLYLAHDPVRRCCTVKAAFPGTGRPVDELGPFPIEGFLARVLEGCGAEIHDVASGAGAAADDSIDALARSQILGVPITYGQGDKRVVPAALLLVDKPAVGPHPDGAPFDNYEMQVASSFAAILGGLLGARRAAELDKEQAMAHEIQQQILPASALELPGFDVAAEYRACGAVGGDYFDYVPLADGRQMVAIADVSGHNLASGMVMVSARAMLRTLASVSRDPAQVFDQLAASMYEDLTRIERFLTAAAVVLRDQDRTVQYVNAGHNDLLIYRAATDRVETVGSQSTILGFVREPGYESRQIVLAPGDCLLMFTDGITEAMDDNEQMFGDDRLAQLFAQLAPGHTAADIVAGLLHELDQFRRGRQGLDDVTIVVIRCTDRGDGR